MLTYSVEIQWKCDTLRDRNTLQWIRIRTKIDKISTMDWRASGERRILGRPVTRLTDDIQKNHRKNMD